MLDTTKSKLHVTRTCYQWLRFLVYYRWVLYLDYFHLKARASAKRMNSVTTMKDAIKEWERANGKRIVTASEVKLNGILPPLDKMDNMLMTFVRCE